MSKHQLLVHWPTPVIVRNIAKFVGFLQFYSWFIPNFKVRIFPLCNIMQAEYTLPIGSSWTPAANAAFKEMWQAILSDPYLRHYDHCKLLVLCIDFLANGFGYIACQPANDDVSLAAMNRCMRGNGFNLMTKTSAAVLHPVAFGCHRTHGNELKLHSHLGEGFAGDWAINKNRHMCFSQQFTWVTDCCAIKFVLSYDGRNPSILHLQMRLMCWDMDIKHRNDIFLMNADYWSRLGVNLCFNPLLKSYIEQVNSFCHCRPSLTALPPLPENTPYFHGPHLPPQDANTADSLPGVHLSMPINSVPTVGFQHVLNYAVCFGKYVGPCPTHAHGAKPQSPCTTRNSQSQQASYQNLIRLCMVLTTAISHRQSWSSACHSRSSWHAILMQMVALCSQRSACAQQLYLAHWHSLTTFALLVIMPRWQGI